ncbi:MAG TPA: hypothetical protein DEP28_08635 [Bacteroidetes bacterium]|nr:hypothetical protein [Bacteroidota bacterium]
MIQIKNIETFPTEIKSVILSRKNELIDELLKESEFLESEEKYWTSYETPIKNEVITNLKKILINKSFSCFHCTKIINKSEIADNGLYPLNIKDLGKRILNNISNYLTDVQINIFNNAFNNFQDGILGCRENMIWFVSNYEITRTTGCEYFYNYYGGEVTRRILYDYQNDFYPILKRIGMPATVECCIETKELFPNHFDNLIVQIIDSLLSENQYINWEFYLSKHIPADKIIKIYEE